MAQFVIIDTNKLEVYIYFLQTIFDHIHMSRHTHIYHIIYTNKCISI